MKKSTLTLIAIALAIFTTKSSASFLPYDITVNDGLGNNSTYGSDSRPGINEVGETEANTVASNIWDLKAMLFGQIEPDITIIGGFNPLTTTDGFGIGDLFIDTDNNIVANPARSGNGYVNFTNPGYEFVIDITGSSGNMLTYNIVQLTPSSVVRSGFYAQNNGSDPVRYVSGGTVLVSGLTTTVNTQTDQQVSGSGSVNIGNSTTNVNYVYSFELDPIVGSLVNGASFHLTQDCGNDTLHGVLPPNASAVPEPSAALLAAVGTIVMVFRRRRQQ